MTPRELDVVAELIRGAGTITEAARRLDMSPHTARRHLDRAGERIGAYGPHRTLHVAIHAIAAGLVDTAGNIA